MRLFIFLTLLLPLSACFGDDALRPYGGNDKIWFLSSLRGEPFPAIATLTFPEAGRIAGQAPCNRYFAPMSTPYPRFEPGPIAATRRACAELSAEGAFLTTLQRAKRAEVRGAQLILSDDTGTLMVFNADG